MFVNVLWPSNQLVYTEIPAFWVAASSTTKTEQIRMDFTTLLLCNHNLK